MVSPPGIVSGLLTPSSLAEGADQGSPRADSSAPKHLNGSSPILGWGGYGIEGQATVEIRKVGTVVRQLHDETTQQIGVLRKQIEALREENASLTAMVKNAVALIEAMYKNVQ